MYTPSIARDTKTLKAWCVARSDKPLHELQVEMCEWAVKSLKRSADWPDVSGSRRRVWIAAIEAEIVSLTKSKRAVPSDWFRGEAYTPFSAEQADHFRKRNLDRDKKSGEKRTSGFGKK